MHGRYLWDVRSVTFGGVPSPQFGGQDTTLDVQLPNHTAATTTVTVTTATGSSRAAGAATSFEFFPPPALWSVSSSAGPLSGGNTVTLTGSGLRAPMSVRFGSAAATEVTVRDASTATVTVPPQGVGVVPVTVTTPVDTTAAGNKPTYRYGVSVPQQWSAPQTVDPVNSITRLACDGASFCMATDSNNRYLTRGPTGWNPVSADTRDGAAGGRALSCPEADFCMAAAGRYIWTWDGASWTWSNALAPFIVTDVACTSPSFCAAIGGFDEGATWNGVDWSPTVHESQNASLDALSCWADGQCAAVDTYRSVVVLSNGRWVETERINRGDESGAAVLRCTGPSSCLAGTTFGGVATSAGEAPHILSGEFIALDCTSDSSCLAVGDKSTATWDGTSWSAPVTAPAPITAVSCPANHSCVVASDHDVRTLTW